MEKVLIKEKEISLVELNREHKEVLLSWLSDKRLLAFWEGEDEVFTPDRIERDFYSDEPIKRCIIYKDDRAIGYAQMYEVDSELALEYEYEYKQNVFAFDLFIGIPELWDKGIGKKIVRLISSYLKNECGAERIIVDPHADNRRALMCYYSQSFVLVKHLKEHEKHNGKFVDCLLLEKIL